MLISKELVKKTANFLTTGNLIVNILPAADPKKNHKIWMYHRWTQFLLSQLKWGKKSKKLISLRGPCLLRRPKQNRPKKHPSLFSQSKQSAECPRKTSHLPQCCCFYTSILVLDLESWGLRWSKRSTGTVPTPVVHQCVINVCHPSPNIPHPALHTPFRWSYCAWWLIHALRSANNR